nr:unnamed protein product [Callosobruchus analis]
MGHDERMFIRRRPGERYESRSWLLRTRSTLIAQRYIADVVEAELVPYTQQLPGHIFQQNDARPHVAQPVIESLNRHTIIALVCWFAR